jgi:hypothetical protein
VKFIAAICILASLSIAACGKDSQPPSPTPTKEQAPPKQEATALEEGANPDVGTATPPPLVQSPPANAPAESHQANTGEKPVEKWWETGDGLTALFTGLLFLVGFGQVLLFWWQLSLIRGGIDDTKKAIDIAEKTAMATKDMVTIMQDTAEKDLRAYLVVEIPNLKMDLEVSGLPRVYSVPIKNCGKTPAREVRTEMQWTFHEGSGVEWPEKVTLIDEKSDRIKGPGSVATVGGGQPLPVEFRLVDHKSLGKTFLEIFSRFRQKDDIVIFFQGVCTYRDIFDKSPRFVVFCHFLYWNEDGNMTGYNYSKYNYTDAG